MKKIIIAGEIYSANQGDGLIYENLASLFRKTGADIQIAALDISGRQPGRAATPAGTARLSWIRWAENHIPGPFSLINALMQFWWARKRLRGSWGKSLEHASALVIGGGQLLLDNQLGFPVKLFYLARAARRKGIPVYVIACGVGAKWSTMARWLFASVLRNAHKVTVRDPLSQERLTHFIPDVKAMVTFDPAIWSAEVFRRAHHAGIQKVIGLGAISRQDVNLHLEKTERFSEETWLALWQGILQALHNAGNAFEIFTNGSLLDQTFAHRLAGAVEQSMGMDCRVALQPESPAALANIVSGYDAVIAVRLHANILANAYGIPTIGLVWDKKVAAYYDMMGLPERCIDIRAVEPRQLVAMLKPTIGQGLDAGKLLAVKEAAQENISAVLEEL